MKLFGVFLFLHFALAFQYDYAVAAAAPRTVTLKQALELATRNSLEFADKAGIVDEAEARQKQARAAGYPKLSATAVLSPIYSAQGDALFSNHDMSKWGFWLQSTVTIIQPIYTFGKLSSLREAAALGSEVARAQLRRDVHQITFETKQLYYGAILAEQLYNFLEEGKKDIHDILVKAEEDQQKKKPSIKKRDFFRLKIFDAEAGYRLEEVRKLRMLAHHMLSLKLGFDPNEETLPQETTLEPIEESAPSEDKLVEILYKERPEFAMLRNGIAAKQALLSVEKTNKFPVIFIGGLLSFAYSDVRNRQQSAFANDPYNRNTGGAGVGMQWNWDFATTFANQAAIQVEIDQLERKQAYAKAGLKLEVKKALADLNEAKYRLQTSKDAFQMGRKWLVSETMGYSIGLIDVKDLIDAYLARAKTAKDHWEATYNVNMAWASLSKAVGQELEVK